LNNLNKMQDHHINNKLSALVMLGAIALTYTTYSSYKAEVSIDTTEQATVAMDQAANAFLSFKIDRATQVVEVSTTTEESSVKADTKAD
jgi:hypothetical protein